MQRHQFCRIAAVVIVGCLAVLQPSLASQSSPDSAVRERLNRIHADLFSATPHPSEAIDELKGVLAEDPELPEAHMLLGIAYRSQGSPELLGQAIAELRQALGLKPTLVVARLALARVYLDVSRAARAREELEVALEQIPGHPHLLSLLGEAERQLGNPQRSVELNREALKANEDFMQARYYLGVALMELRQHTEAIREFQLVVKSGVNRAEATLGLGSAYLEAGRVDEAVAPLREAARLDPSRTETHLQLSRAYRTTGRLAEADKSLARAMKPGPEGLSALYQGLEPALYMEQGLVRIEQGRLEAAAQSFQKVLAVDATHEAAKQALAEVKNRLKERARRKSGQPL